MSSDSVPLMMRPGPRARLEALKVLLGADAGAGASSDKKKTKPKVKKETKPKIKKETKPKVKKETKPKVKKETKPKVKKETKPKVKKTTKKKTTKKKTTKKKTTKKKEAKPKKEEPPIREWWKEPPLEEGKKWRSLEHNGVYFAEPWKPHGRPIIYEGEEIVLPPLAEQYATLFAQSKDNDNYGANPVFRANFWKDFRKMCLVPAGLKHVKDIKKVDWSRILEWLEEEKQRKAAKTKEQRAAEKAKREAIKEKHGYVMIDGFKEELGNFTIEPPGLFRGRGEHPKRGSLKPITWPEDITLNLSVGAAVPPCPLEGHSWGGVVHNDASLWVATWREKVCGQRKYVWPAASSSLKQRSDMAKFDKARELQYHVDALRTDYNKKLKSKTAHIVQTGLAIWIIDVLALRVGMEKNAEEEAETYGACSLLVEHLTLHPPDDDHSQHRLQLQFLGKDSMPYDNTVEIPDVVAEATKVCLAGKNPSDSVFDAISPSGLNDYLKGFMAGLSAKVFRTYNASVTLERELSKIDDLDATLSQDQLRVFYNNANRTVAILCNHKRTVNEDSFKSQVGRMQERLTKAKAMLTKRNKALKEARAAKKENPTDKTKKAVIRAKAMADKQKARVQKIKSEMTIKEDNKEVALGTSKINYMDPRITHAWCKKVGLDVKKVFNASLIKKFPWADVDPDWKFVCPPEVSGIVVKKPSRTKRKRTASTKSSKKTTKKKKTTAAKKKKATKKKSTKKKSTKKKSTKKKSTKKKAAKKKAAKKKAYVEDDDDEHFVDMDEGGDSDDDWEP